MIGTLIGLINMLANLADPSSIGAGMATALITTFYGAILANAFFLPLAGKLEVRSSEEILVREMIIDGIMAIQSGDSPRIVEEKLKSFLMPPSSATWTPARSRRPGAAAVMEAPMGKKMQVPPVKRWGSPAGS